MMFRSLATPVLMILSLYSGAVPAYGFEGEDAREKTMKSAESSIRQLLDPLLEGYCQVDSAGMPSCKILQVSVQVDRESSASLAPGFDDIQPHSALKLVPKSASLRLLIDSKIGPVSRRKLLEMVDQYLSVLNYPVTVDAKTATFPQPAASAGKVAAIRDKVVRGFRSSAEGVLAEYCGPLCVMGEVSLNAEAVNPEELQYEGGSDLIQQDGVAIRVNGVSASIMMDESLSEQERKSLLDLIRLKSASFKDVDITAQVMKFPTLAARDGLPGFGPGGSRAPAGSRATESNSNESTNQTSSTTDTKNQLSNTSDNRSETSNSSTNSNQSSENHSKQESFSRIERIERVENGDAVQAQLEKFKQYGIILSAIVLSLLGLIAALGFRQSGRSAAPSIQPLAFAPNPGGGAPVGAGVSAPASPPEERARNIAVRYEIERQKEELSTVFAESPKVAKVVFSRILTEEGVETTAAYMQIFGESIVIDMLRDPSLQSDLNQLTEYFARNTIELSDEEQVDLLRKLQHRTVAGKLVVLGSRASSLFEFLVEMDGQQIAELVRTESMTVKAIIATQCDATKRSILFQQLDDSSRIELMAELSRIDYLPRDYIHNVAQALKRKRRENPRLNTEALPGSDVLVGLLERTNPETQRSVMRNLLSSHPESVRTIMGKLVSVDTLRFMREGHMLEILLAIKHDELLQFLRGVSGEVRDHVFLKAPKDLVVELEDELESLAPAGRDVYQAVERKILNRIKMMAQEGTINLQETNERMFADAGFLRSDSGMGGSPQLRRVA